MNYIQILGRICLVGAIVPLIILIYQLDSGDAHAGDLYNAIFAVLVAIFLLLSRFWAFIDPDLMKADKENKLLEKQIEGKNLRKQLKDN